MYYSPNRKAWQVQKLQDVGDATKMPLIQATYDANDKSRCPTQATGWEYWTGKKFEAVPLSVVSKATEEEEEKANKPYRYSAVLEDEDAHEMDVNKNIATQKTDSVPDTDLFAAERCKQKKGKWMAGRGTCVGAHDDTSHWDG